MPQDQTPPIPWVTVDWGLTLDADTQSLYQQMATLLSNYTAVPLDRANYFAEYIDNIGSWGGMVNSVQGDGGGYVVTVSVEGFIDQDQLDNDETGSLPMILFANYAEIYHVDSMNNVTYVGHPIPAGWPTQVSFGGSA